MKGLVHIYTGDGKGKTTAAVGLAVRAAGVGMRVLFVQFLKGRETGEIESLRKIGVEVIRTENVTKFIPYMTSKEFEQCRLSHQTCFKAVCEAAAAFDVLILDEAMGAISTGMISLQEILEFIAKKPESTELLLTGRDAPLQLIELADYVCEIKSIKHPYEKGVSAREGIEY